MLVRGVVCVCVSAFVGQPLSRTRGRVVRPASFVFCHGSTLSIQFATTRKPGPGRFFSPPQPAARAVLGGQRSSPCRSQPSSRLSSGASLSFRPPFRTPPRSGPTTARARATKPDSRCVWHVKKASHDKNTAPLHTADGSTPRPVLPALQRGAELLTHQACLCTHRRVRWSRC